MTGEDHLMRPMPSRVGMLATVAILLSVWLQERGADLRHGRTVPLQNIAEIVAGRFEGHSRLGQILQSCECNPNLIPT